MASRTSRTRRASAILAAVLALMVFACRSGTPMEGVYRADENGQEQGIRLSLELKEDGSGTWKAGEDEAPFRWQLKGREIRLATKAGGIIVGRIDGNVIHIELPGRQPLSFTRAD